MPGMTASAWRAFKSGRNTPHSVTRLLLLMYARTKWVYLESFSIFNHCITLLVFSCLFRFWFLNKSICSSWSRDICFSNVSWRKMNKAFCVYARVLQQFLFCLCFGTPQSILSRVFSTLTVLFLKIDSSVWYSLYTGHRLCFWIKYSSFQNKQSRPTVTVMVTVMVTVTDHLF